MEYEDLFVVVYMVHETSFITFTKKKTSFIRNDPMDFGGVRFIIFFQFF